jgi:flagellar hook protein FlgE
MSLYTALYTGVTSLSANSQDLSVTGDNIANANTIGFKHSRAAFEDVLGKSLIANSGEVGLGAKLQQVQKILTQGALTYTGMATDLALEGKGFFVVDTPDGNMYTRNGQFTIDEDGDLVTLAGLKVQGYGVDANGNVAGTLDNLAVGEATMPPSATIEVTVQGNLPSGTEINDAYLNFGWDPNNPDTYDYTTSLTLYDSLGNPHDATVYFSNIGPGQWEYTVATDGENLEGGTPGVIEPIDGGSLEFDGQGALVNHSQNLSPGFNPLGALQPQDFILNFGDPADPEALGMTGNASPFGIRYVGNDGYSAGELSSIQFDD